MFERGPTERGPTERDPTERGPTERGPTERGPTGHGAGFVIWSLPGSNLHPCCWMDLCWVVRSSTPQHFVNSWSAFNRLSL